MWHIHHIQNFYLSWVLKRDRIFSDDCALGFLHFVLPSYIKNGKMIKLNIYPYVTPSNYTFQTIVINNYSYSSVSKKKPLTMIKISELWTRYIEIFCPNRGGVRKFI